MGPGATARALDVPQVLPFPPATPDGPPLPLGRQPREVDRSQRTSPRIVASLAGPARHGGEATLLRGVSDGAILRQASDAGRTRYVRAIRGAGLDIVRVQAEWRAAFTGRPATNPADPADPAYSFGRLDAMVRAVDAAHATPLLVVSHAPLAAETAPRWRFAAAGSWAPDDEQLALFAQALAVRYSGRYVPPGAAAPLPRVTWFQAWNEPNLPQYLAPQWTGSAGRWVPWSPRYYRAMLNAFFDAVKAVRPDARVVSAGLAPDGDAIDGVGRMTPLRFARAFLCLDPAGRPSVPRCPDPPKFDAFAFHPLSTGDPDRPAASAWNIAIADIGKLTRTLDRAARARLIRPDPELWITELNWTSPARGPQARRRARWVGRGLHRLWRAGARVVIWQFWRDRAEERPAGLQTRAGVAKPLQRAFTFPFDALRIAPRHVRVWLVAPSGTACVQRRADRGPWRTVRCVRTRAAQPRTVNIVMRRGGWVRATAGTADSPAAYVRRATSAER